MRRSLLNLAHSTLSDFSKIRYHTVTEFLHARFKEIWHLLYSPDMSPSDYHQFPNLMKHLCEQRFSTDMNSSMQPKTDWRGSQKYFILQPL